MLIGRESLLDGVPVVRHFDGLYVQEEQGFYFNEVSPWCVFVDEALMKCFDVSRNDETF